MRTLREINPRDLLQRKYIGSGGSVLTFPALIATNEMIVIIVRLLHLLYLSA